MKIKFERILKDKTTWVFGILIFLAFIFLTTGSIKMSVLVLDEKGNQTSRQDFEVLHSTSTLQSIFGTGAQSTLIAQAMEPISPENRAIFKVRIDNPYPEAAKLLKISVVKNGKEVYSKEFNQKIVNSYLFTTDAINLKGLDAQRNSIIITATLEYGGERTNQFFEYHYLSLTTCQRDTDCKNIEQKCDLGNQARFSNDKKRYCAWTCISHDQCKADQVCIKGFCGY